MAGGTALPYLLVLCGHRLLLAGVVSTRVDSGNGTMYEGTGVNSGNGTKNEGTGVNSGNGTMYEGTGVNSGNGTMYEDTGIYSGNGTIYEEAQDTTTVVAGGFSYGNDTMYEDTQDNSTMVAGDIWEITETAANETTEEPDGLFLRGGWTSKKQNLESYSETNEGWLNSGMIAKDASIPYVSAVVATNRLGNSSEEWKKLLVKPEKEGHHHKRSRVSKLIFNERRNIPFQFHWQLNPKRLFNSSKNP